MASRLAPRLALVQRASAAAEPRRQPSQDRGRRRVARLLAAAGAVLDERGYGATTMSAIATRASTAIGSLYQFFPNKEILAEALRARYVEVSGPLWEALIAAAPRMNAPELAHRLVATRQETIRRCPGFTALLDAPRTSGSNRRRDQLRQRIAAVLRARQPELATAAALQYATVIQQVLRAFAMNNGAYAADFEEILAAYLRPRLGVRA